MKKTRLAWLLLLLITGPAALAQTRSYPKEIRGYKKTDSISEVQRKRDEGDTLKSKKKHKGFQPQDVLTGNTYSLGKTSSFALIET